MDFADLKVPAPTVTALTAPFWQAADAGRLAIQRCEACDKAVFYPRGLCPHCWHDRLRWEDASGEGRLKSFSIVHRPGHTGWLPIAPYPVGLVELREGPTLLSFILREPGEDLVVGAVVHMTPTQIGGRTLPAFRQRNSHGRTRNERS